MMSGDIIAPPKDTRIKIKYNQEGRQQIIIPQRESGVGRYLVGAFLLFWLGGWAIGWISAARQLLSGLVRGLGGGGMFLLFWLGGWTVGGAFAVYYIYRIFRPAVPESLVLSYSSVVYDSGVSPFQFSFSSRSRMHFWKELFQKRIKTEFDLTQLKTLKLREFDSGNRLTIDQGNKRYDLAAGASEPEREWLFGVLNDRYNS